MSQQKMINYLFQLFKYLQNHNLYIVINFNIVSMQMNIEQSRKDQFSQQADQLNQIIDLFLDKQNPGDSKIKKAFASLFDLMLWAQKRNSNMLKTVLDMDILSLVIQKYCVFIETVINGFTLLLGNAKQNGQIVKYVLERRLGDYVIRSYISYLAVLVNFEEQQHLHVLASFLKAYHRHFTQNTFRWFIEQDQCLLIKVCCRFFNCSQEITRTSIMNILMTILKLPFIKAVIDYKKIGLVIESWCINLCRLFRNQLKDFDQHLLITQQQESEYIINSINDKIILWQDLSELGNNIFSISFYEQIVVPLVVGSLNTNGIPLFTLKFALFIINKLVGILSNLNLLNQIGQLLFKGQEVEYTDNQLGTAILKPFNLRKLQQQHQQQQQDDQKSKFKGVNLLFMNILRSKDGRFLECVCLLITNIVSAVKKYPDSINFYIKQLGFGINGLMVGTITEILINQFTAVHTLQIIKIICSLLVYIQPTKYLVDDLKNRFTYMYKAVLNETIMLLQKNKQIYSFIAQILEYDAKIVSSNTFCFTPQLKSDSALLFNNNIIDNDSLPFSLQIPETRDNQLRYHIMKALILRKLSTNIVQECHQDNGLQKYLQRTRINQAKYVKPGQYLKLPIQCNSYRCKLQDAKTQISNCLLLEDEDNLILGYVQKMQIKIILNIKLKHIGIKARLKKDKIYIDVEVRRFEYLLQSLVVCDEIILKNIEIGLEYFKLKRQRTINKQISSILQILKRSLEYIPQVSLI